MANDQKAKHKKVATQEVATGPVYQVIVFRLGTEEYGLMIDQIKEVVITPRIAKVPLTPSYVKGVANIRGNIMAIVDLEEKFGLKEGNAEAVSQSKYYSLVVESEAFNMAILVKDVPNTLSVTESQIDRSSGLVTGVDVDKQYINGIIKSDDRLIILIDIHRVITKEDVSSTLSHVN